MRTVAELIEALKQFPPDARAYAYEGEITGIVITKEKKQLGWIPASEFSETDGPIFRRRGDE